MSLFNEKRSGRDRRKKMATDEVRTVERRRGKRREVELFEISFIEWARQFASYKKQGGSR